MRPYEIPFEDVLISAATIEPLDLEEMKKQRRVTSDTLNTLFDLWMSAARQEFEEMTGLQLVTAERAFVLESFPWQREIQLGRAPVQAIERIVYDGADGTEVTLDPASYRLVSPLGVDIYPTLSSVETVTGSWPNAGAWPSAATGTKAVRIYYRAGYGDAPGAVPEIIRVAMMNYVGAFHRYGEEETTENKGRRLEIGAQMVIRKAKGNTLRTVYPMRAAPRAAWPG